MRISATVEVSNRLLPSLNMIKKRPEVSYLSIGYGSKKDAIFILHQTLKNSVGVKYKVCKNIVNIFDKFLSEGKITIRFNQPQVDLIIKGEPKKVKEFLQVLKSSMKDKTKISKLSNLMNAPTKVINESVSKLIIQGKNHIPAYPRALEYLEVSECYLKKIDCRILRLQNLRALNLRNNALESLPNQLDLLPNLETLILNENKLGRSSFSWLNAVTLRNNLKVLELKSNEIKFPPNELVYLRNLEALSLDRNGMLYLPKRIGNLSKLRKLEISHNNIAVFPGSIITLKLSFLDYSSNVFSTVTRKPPTQANISNLPSLVDIAGKEVLKERIYYDETTLPRTLIFKLANSGLCVCGSPSFSSVKKYYNLTPMILRRFCGGYICSMDTMQPLLSFSPCREKCPKLERMPYEETDQVPICTED